MLVFPLFGGPQVKVATCLVDSTHVPLFWLAERSRKPTTSCQSAFRNKLYASGFSRRNVLNVNVWFFRRRKRQNSDTVLDDRDEYSNGRPMRMNKTSRKRRSLQKKRLMGSTESLGGLEELAASRASKNWNFVLWRLWLLYCLLRTLVYFTRESRNVAKVVFLFIIIIAIWRFVHICI